MSRLLTLGVLSQLATTDINTVHFTHTLSSADETVNLPSNVPVGKSWVMVSSMMGDGQARRDMVSALLTTESGGNFTQIRLRLTAYTDPITVGIQVVYGDDFTVQILEATPSGATHNFSITTVDTSKTFAVINHQGDVQYRDSCYRAILTSTQLQMSRAQSTGSPRIVGYVVTWEGATVTQKQLTLSGTSTSDTAPADSFVIHNYNADHASTPDRGADMNLVLAKIDGGNVVLERESSSGTINANCFLIQHPAISIAKSIQSTTGGTYTGTGTFVRAKSFLATSFLGNGKSTATSTTNGMLSGGHTHEMTSDNNYRMRRTSETGTLTISVQIIS